MVKTKKKTTAPSPQKTISEIPTAKDEPKKTKSDTVKVKGLIDGLVTMPFEIIGSERERWKLSATESTRLKEAVSGFLESKNLEKLNDPGVYLVVVVMLIIVPRAILEIRDGLQNKKNPQINEKGHPEPNNPNPRQEGIGKNAPDYDVVTPAT